MPRPTDAELTEALRVCNSDTAKWDALDRLVLAISVPALIEEVRKLREAIDAALEPLGSGACVVNTCKGCKVERKEAIAILRAALKGQDATQS